MTVFPLGDSAVVIVLGETADAATAARVRTVAAELQRNPLPGTVDVVPAFASVAVFFDTPWPGGWDELKEEVAARIDRADAAGMTNASRRIELPVCYGGEFGPDLEGVAAHARLPAAEVIAQHSAPDYLVHAIGFAPGFPYLGGLPPALATPRRATPRAHVPAGSVGIGGAQTGVYPLETPGGWNLIGRTPLALFDASRPEPSLVRAGDRVRFRPISRVEFDAAAERSRVDEFGPPPALSDAVPGIEVVRAGMFTTVQDLGRRGHRAEGVPLSGAADVFAARLANLQVGNPERAAVLEFTLVGPELRFLHDTVIAIAGGEFGALPRGRPLAIRGGSTVRLGPAQTGCRGYLAVAGGIDVAPVLGSRSTYVRGGFGGFAGRVLRDGDVLPVPAGRPYFGGHWHIDERIGPEYSARPTIRAIGGEHADEFDPAWMAATFSISAQSDRMGVRLRGTALQRTTSRELLSSPVAPGTIQVPPDGQPIILLADAQTVGGYPQVAHVISVDLPLIAQLRPGDTITVRRVTRDEARDLSAAQERALGLLREGLAQKLA